VFGTIALLLLAPGSLGLVALSLAALLVAAGLRRPRERVVAGVVGALGLAWVASPTTDPLSTALGAYSLIVAAAFASGSLVAPAGMLRQAWRAMCWGIAGVALLGVLMRGTSFWSELRWSLVRDLSSSLRLMMLIRPDAQAMFEPAVRLLGRAYPVYVVGQTLAGLALAWHWHARIALAPLGATLGASPESRPEPTGGVPHRGGAVMHRTLFLH
jgi:hypothetical protein